jgi:hypothetical protein
MTGYHIGRSWAGQRFIEDECPCPKAPCGLVDESATDPTCPEHPPERCKTMRQRHSPEQCPGPPADKPCTGPDCPECRLFEEN